MGDLGEKLIASTLEHTAQININTVTALFNPIITNPEDSILRRKALFYNPDLGNKLPMSIPLKGGGSLNLGLNDPDTFKPQLFVELNHMEPNLTPRKFKGNITFIHDNGPFRVNSATSTDDTTSKELFAALARLSLTIKNDVDIDSIPEPSNEMRWILNKFGVNLP